jgi:hypothetical protein
MGIEELDRMTPKAREKYLEIIRAIPLGRKLELTAELCDTTREWALAGIRLQHPELSEEDVRKEYIRRNLPPELRKKVYGW